MGRASGSGSVREWILEGMGRRSGTQTDPDTDLVRVGLPNDRDPKAHVGFSDTRVVPKI